MHNFNGGAVSMNIRFKHNMTRIDIVPAIDFLKLKNYGPIKEKEFRFSDNLNIITGESGTGKTAVLTALYDFLAGGLDDNYFMTDNSSIDIKLAGGWLHTEGEAYLDMLEFIANDELSGVPRYEGTVKKKVIPGSLYNTFMNIGFLDYFNSLVGDYCLLIDDFGSIMDKENREEATEKLLTTRGQIIITAAEEIAKNIPRKNGDKKFTMDTEVRKR